MQCIWEASGKKQRSEKKEAMKSVVCVPTSGDERKKGRASPRTEMMEAEKEAKEVGIDTNRGSQPILEIHALDCLCPHQTPEVRTP